MEPTTEQLRAFYQFVRRAVLLSSFIAFIELGQDKNLYVHVGRYKSQATLLFRITPTGEVNNGE
jgi:hypothetical protein